METATRRKVILDTDIGTDIDDALALLLVLKSGELDLKAVTTVSGDTHLRARIAKKLLRLASRDDIQVGAGLDKPPSGTAVNSMGGWEGQGFLDPNEPDSSTFMPASELIVSALQENLGNISIITIGPLTNVASALRQEPELARGVSDLIIMGGAINQPKLGWDWRAEYNLNSDPEAARVVFGSGIPTTMVGLDVTLSVWIAEDQLSALRAINTPLMHGISNMVDIWLTHTKSYGAYLHDPLAVGVAINPMIVETRSLHIALEMSGGVLRTIPVAGRKANTEACVRVDSEGFLKMFMERIAR